ncbi:MAG: sodium:calcium antiporter [Nitrospirae bacterium]|nr:sodium:calcium antiporter [Nitrospirota bacterium]MBI3352690.1 sodium:calcium antiporter [Nitrospirota bacterium]
MTYSLVTALMALAVTLLGSSVFTNGIEWIGKKLKLSDGAVGSVLAGVGTALPETLIPLIAILFGHGLAEKEIGIGAILGAPFMLSTLTLPLVGFGVYFFARTGKRTRQFHLNFKEIEIDLKYFLISFSLAVAASAIENRLTHTIIGLFLFGLYANYLRDIFKRPSSDHLDLEPLYFQKFIRHPGVRTIVVQTLFGLGLIVGGAVYFIEGIAGIADFFHVSPFILSLLITPIATELPEKFNSLIWISKKKDHLAVSNITGAMVFQSTFPVSIGLFGTAWAFDRNGMTNIILTFVTALFFFSLLLFKKKWEPYHLMLGTISYIAYVLILIFY